MKTTLANTKENSAKVKALKKVANTKWAGTTIHDTMDKCLVAICLFSGVNSGWYTPLAVRIDGLTGWFMVNQDGSLFCESRVIKEDEKKYRIEHMANSAWNEFENDYFNFLDE
jgi:hypothetical protein